MSRHRVLQGRLRADGLRNVATAAAVASGALAVVTPTVGLEDLDDAAAESTGAFRLTAEDTSAARAAQASAPRTEPVLAGADELVRASGLLEATGSAGKAVTAERDRIAQAARDDAARDAADRPAPPAAGAPAPSSA